MSPKRRIVLGLFAFGACLAGLYMLGAYAVKDLPRGGWNEGSDPSALESGAVYRAALSPWHRSRAVSWAEHMANSVAPQTEASASRHVDLVEIQSGCAAAVLAAVQHGLVDEATRRAEACGAPVPPAAQCRQARFAGVGDAISEQETDNGYAFRDVLALLAGGEGEHAVRDMRAAAEHERTQEHGTSESAAYSEQLAQKWEILADAVAARTGDEQARARLLATEQDSSLARLLLADLASGAERVERAEALLAESDVRERRATLALILLAEQAPARAAEVLEAGLHRVLVGTWGWAPDTPRPALREALAAVDAENAGGPPLSTLRAYLRLLRVQELTRQARLDEASAMLTQAAGDLGAARARAPEGDAPPEALRRIEDAIAVRRAEIALEADDEEGASAIASTASDLVRRQVEDRLQQRRDGMGPLSWRMVPESGREMARLMRPGDPIGQLTEPWRLQRVEHDREALMSHIRFSSDHLNAGCWPAMRFERAAREAQLARVLAQDEWHQDALARIRRFDEAFARRDSAMALYVADNIRLVGE